MKKKKKERESETGVEDKEGEHVRDGVLPIGLRAKSHPFFSPSLETNGYR